MAETIFGPTLTLSTGRIIPTRWVGEQHVKEDLGFIPSFADWVKAIRPEPWMGRTERIEALVDPHLASPVVEVAEMTDPAYQRLGLPVTASPYTVLRAAVRALHPDTRAVRGFRAARKRFYRQMLCAHAARQALAGRADRLIAFNQLSSQFMPGLSAGLSPSGGPMADYFTHFSCLLDVGTPTRLPSTRAVPGARALRIRTPTPGGRGLRSRAPGRARGQHPLDP